MKKSKIVPFDLELFIVESNAIEGIHVTPALLASPHILGQMRAFYYVDREMKWPITENDILLIHKYLMEDLRGDAGQIRNGMVSVGGHIPPAPGVLHLYLADLVTNLNFTKEMLAARDIDPAYYAYKQHLEFEYIHPFSDGNGRTGRLLLYAYEKFLGLKPRIILQAEVNTYYHDLAEYSAQRKKLESKNK